MENPSQLPTIDSEFFADLGQPQLPAKPSGAGTWAPSKVMLWYSSIADDLLAHPGTSLKDCAARLGRNPATIRLICNSDLFRTYWETRRARFNEDLQQKLITKMTKVADKALDLTLEVMEKKGDTVPLKQLHEIASGTLDRLGYSPSRSDSVPGVTVNVSNSAQAAVAPQASASSIEKAREAMRRLQASAASSSPPLIDHQPAAVEVGEES